MTSFSTLNWPFQTYSTRQCTGVLFCQFLESFYIYFNQCQISARNRTACPVHSKKNVLNLLSLFCHTSVFSGRTTFFEFIIEYYIKTFIFFKLKQSKILFWENLRRKNFKKEFVFSVTVYFCIFFKIFLWIWCHFLVTLGDVCKI